MDGREIFRKEYPLMARLVEEATSEQGKAIPEGLEKELASIEELSIRFDLAVEERVVEEKDAITSKVLETLKANGVAVTEDILLGMSEEQCTHRRLAGLQD